MKRGLPEKRPIPNVSKVVAVSSAKGGVGKSTIAVNLALAMARKGVPTGILDADIYGPSVPTLLNLEGLEPELDSQHRLVPLTAYGLKAMSMGFLVPQDSPIAWRGLMVQKAMNQLMFEVSWPYLDLLILDLPPGTGDVQLTITQNIELNGAGFILAFSYLIPMLTSIRRNHRVHASRSSLARCHARSGPLQESQGAYTRHDSKHVYLCLYKLWSQSRYFWSGRYSTAHLICHIGPNEVQVPKRSANRLILLFLAIFHCILRSAKMQTPANPPSLPTRMDRRLTPSMQLQIALFNDWPSYKCANLSIQSLYMPVLAAECQSS